jgi:hypothetical protein
LRSPLSLSWLTGVELNSTDLNSDIALADGSETVSVTLRRADGQTTIVVAGGLRRSTSARLHETKELSLRGEETVWHLPAAALGGTVSLEAGDTITANGTTWSITVAALETLGTRWRCACARQP